MGTQAEVDASCNIDVFSLVADEDVRCRGVVFHGHEVLAAWRLRTRELRRVRGSVVSTFIVMAVEGVPAALRRSSFGITNDCRRPSNGTRRVLREYVAYFNDRCPSFWPLGSSNPLGSSAVRMMGAFEDWRGRDLASGRRTVRARCGHILAEPSVGTDGGPPGCPHWPRGCHPYPRISDRPRSTGTRMWFHRQLCTHSPCLVEFPGFLRSQ